jgi:hypothetical protein
VEGAKQVPFDWQGRGPGRLSWPGPLAVIERWVEIDCVEPDENDAEARPTKATTNPKMRMASFIFGNLMSMGSEGE